MNQLITKQITDYKVCVIIPTYNNERTLRLVLEGLLEFTSNIIVVNDGSTDTTKSILQSFGNIFVLNVPKNKGKGNALRLGFKKAFELGYQYAITIDSDGQHYPDDIPVFLKEIEKSYPKEVLVIGSRNMAQEGVPSKSSFGNKFSNFWFWFETSIKLQDTQSGYRLYPLNAINKLKLYSNKFELEIEVIVKAAWKGVEVKNVPVKILYDLNERVTHFRPFKDFTRISILNTILVIVALLYIKPRDFFKRIKKKGFSQFLREDLFKESDSSLKKSMSVALGVFVGVSPFWGFQTALVVFLAVLFKLNKAIAFVFSNISIPPLIPFIIVASVLVGQFLLGTTFEYNIDNLITNFKFTKHFKIYIVGSFVLAFISATTFGVFSYLWFELKTKNRK